MNWQAEEKEGRVVLFASRPNDGRGLYKAWVRGPMARCLLGTMAPSGNRLVLRRTLPTAELRAKGCWPVTAVEEELAFPFRPDGGSSPHCLPAGWRRPQGLAFPDPLIDRAFRRSSGGFCREGPDGGLILAYPWAAGRPFPLTPLFCLARVDRVGGQSCLLFSFDREKNPILAHNPSFWGDTNLKA